MPRQAKPSSATNSTGKIPYSRFQDALLALQDKWEEEGLVYYPPLDSASWKVLDWREYIEKRVCNYVEKQRNLRADIFSAEFVSLTPPPESRISLQ